MEAVYVPINEALKVSYPKRKSRKALVGEKINSICWNGRVSSCIWAERGTSEKGNPALAQAIQASVKHARDYLTRELGWDFIRTNGKKCYKMKKVQK